MITELSTRRGFPHWLTRKDTPDGAILTMDCIEPVSIGDGFLFDSPPPSMRGQEELLKEYNFFKVVEILEERPSKGIYDPEFTKTQPTHYKLKCVNAKEEVDVHSVAYSIGY